MEECKFYQYNKLSMKNNSGYIKTFGKIRWPFTSMEVGCEVIIPFEISQDIPMHIKRAQRAAQKLSPVKGWNIETRIVKNDPKKNDMTYLWVCRS